MPFFPLMLVSRLREKAANYRENRLQQKTALFIAATITGLVIGAGAALLKWLIAEISILFASHFRTDGSNWALLILPAVGILLASIFTRYVVKLPMDHASERIRDNMARGDYSLSYKLILGPIVGCALTLGFGGSAGGEDPIAYSGAAVGSNIGKAWKVPKQFMMILLGCGAGAGIAGIFMAPIGGMMFTLEVLKMELSTVAVIALMLACLTAALVCYCLLGFQPDLSFSEALSFDPRLILPLLGLALVCGIYGVYYSRLAHITIRAYKSISNPWIQNLLSGLTVSILVFLLPQLYGEGYQVVGNLLAEMPRCLIEDSLFWHDGLSPWVIILVLSGLVIVKSYATSAVNTGGGVGGDFTPTLFAGCMLGYLYAYVVNLTLGADLPLANYAFYGMAGVMASSVPAPLMAIFITAEMTGEYSLLLPLTIVAAISFGVVRLSWKFLPEMIYKP